MVNVAFVAPVLIENTVLFVKASTKLKGARIGLITHQSLDSIPQEIRASLAGHFKVGNALDPQQIADGVRHLSKSMGKIDRLIGIHEELTIALGEVRDALGIEGISKEVALNFRDKSRMKEILRRHKVPCARHALAQSPQEATAFIREVGFPVVAKPPAGLGTRNTYRLENWEVMQDYLKNMPPSKQNPAMLEEFIQGKEHSFESFVIGGKTVWSSLTRYFPTPLEAMRNPWIQWCLMLPREIDTPQFDDIRKVAGIANQVLGLQNGLSHMEWFRRADGSVAVSEVGARPPGVQIMKLMTFANDMDFYWAWCRLMIFDKFEPPERKFAAGAAFLRGQGKGNRVRKILGLEKAQEEIGDMVCFTQMPKPGQSKGAGYEGEGYIIVRHPDSEKVKWALSRLITLIRVELG